MAEPILVTKQTGDEPGTKAEVGQKCVKRRESRMLESDRASPWRGCLSMAWNGLGGL